MITIITVKNLFKLLVTSGRYQSILAKPRQESHGAQTIVP